MAFALGELLGWMRSGGIAHVVRGSGGGAADLPLALVLENVVFDSREAGPRTLFCAVAGEHTHGVRFLPAALHAGAPVVLVEGEAPAIEDEGTRAVVIEVADVRVALNAAARGWLDRYRPRIVGITGSNGKTTTKDLVAIALQGSVSAAASPGNRNSGWGLPAAVLGFAGHEDVLVLEMGASAPGEIARLCEVARPSIGCITNIGPAHLEFFGDEAGVAHTKGALVECLPDDGVAVLARDDAHFEALAARTRARVVSFGTDARADVRVTAAEPVQYGLALTVAGVSAVLPLFGAHNALNVAAAVAMVQALGVEAATAIQRMQDVRLSPHRSRVVELGDRQVIDDCYNANPASMIAALDSFARSGAPGARRIALLGDMAELGEYAEAGHHAVIAHALDLRGIDRVIVVGERMERASRTFEDERLQARADVDPIALAHLLLAGTGAGDVVLVKASRSVALERVLDVIAEQCHEGPVGPGGQA